MSACVCHVDQHFTFGHLTTGQVITLRLLHVYNQPVQLSHTAFHMVYYVFTSLEIKLVITIFTCCVVSPTVMLQRMIEAVTAV